MQNDKDINIQNFRQQQHQPAAKTMKITSIDVPKIDFRHLHDVPLGKIHRLAFEINSFGLKLREK